MGIRYAAKVDTNQTQIVSALRKAGASVEILSRVGAGFPDILVGSWTNTGRRFNLLLEIKADAKSHLTVDEADWHDAWQGQVDIVRDPQEAVLLLYDYQRGKR